MKRIKFQLAGYMCMVSVFIFLLTGCSQEQPRSSAGRTAVDNKVLSTTSILATIADEDMPSDADPQRPQISASLLRFNEKGLGVAYVTQKGGLSRVVYSGKPGKFFQQIENVTLSPDGQRLAYCARVNDKWCLVIDGSQGMMVNSVGEPVFSPDGQHILYKAQLGQKWYIVVDNKMNGGAQAYDDLLIFSGDSTKIAFVQSATTDRKQRLFVSDLNFNQQWIKESTGSLMVHNAARSRVAAVLDFDKFQRVISFSFDRPEQVREGANYDGISSLVFGPDGETLSYTAEKRKELLVVLNDREERLPKASMVDLPIVRPDLKGVGIAVINSDVYLHHAFTGNGTKEKHYTGVSGLVYTRDVSRYAYAADKKGDRSLIVVNGKEGPEFDKVTTPQFSPDGRFLVYRARKDGRRFMVVADADGTVLRQHSGYELVFQPVFTTDGKSVAYGVKDGRQLIWKVEKL